MSSDKELQVPTRNNYSTRAAQRIVKTRHLRTFVLQLWADFRRSVLAFPIGCGSRIRMSYFVLRASIASACSCPVGLSASGKLIDPRTSLRVLPACGRDTTQRLTAHTGRATFTASGSPVSSSFMRKHVCTWHAISALCCTPCAPSSCPRHCPGPLATMGTPSPYDSGPVGDPVFARV